MVSSFYCICLLRTRGFAVLPKFVSARQKKFSCFTRSAQRRSILLLMGNAPTFCLLHLATRCVWIPDSHEDMCSGLDTVWLFSTFGLLAFISSMLFGCLYHFFTLGDRVALLAEVPALQVLLLATGHHGLRHD